MPSARLLIADDDPELGSILRSELEACGYEVTAVSDGEQAIVQLKQTPYDLAILDIRMPKIDGFGVLKFIRGSMPAIKVIMLTAYADLRHLIMSQKFGADDFLSKPYEFEMLRISIESLLPVQPAG